MFDNLSQLVYNRCTLVYIIPQDTIVVQYFAIDLQQVLNIIPQDISGVQFLYIIIPQDTVVEHYSAIDDCDHTGAGDHSDHQLTPTPSPPIIDRTAISSSPPDIQKCIKRCTALCRIAFPLRITHC